MKEPEPDFQSFDMGPINPSTAGLGTGDGNIDSDFDDFSPEGSDPSPQSSFPLEPVKSGDDTVKIRYGTCHGIVPTIGGVAITSDFNDELNPELTIAVTGVIYIGVDLAADTYEAEAPIIAAAATLPADVDRSKAYHILCEVTLTDGVITLGAPVHRGSVDMASCAGVSNFWDLGGSDYGWF